MKRAASSIVRRSSRCRLSRWTTPVSHTSSWNSMRPFTVTSNSHRAAEVRTTISAAASAASVALMTSMQREAWPNAWPEM